MNCPRGMSRILLLFSAALCFACNKPGLDRGDLDGSIWRAVADTGGVKVDVFLAFSNDSAYFSPGGPKTYFIMGDTILVPNFVDTETLHLMKFRDSITTREVNWTFRPAR